MVRFLHTADWQLDMGFSGRGERAATLRQARLETVSRVLDLARTEAVDFVLVAGDVLEHNQVGRVLLHDLKRVLGDSPCPVYLLPGNHDPLTADSVYLARHEWKELPPQVRVLGEAAPVLAGGARLYPCPCRTRVSSADPTAWIPSRSDGDGIRVGVAHGSWQVRPDLPVDDHPIPLDAAARSGLDYLALGHWHSTFPAAGSGDRTFYSGTPEPTAFGERDAGNVLLVSIDRPGSAPVVEKRRIGRYRWLEGDWTLPDGAAVDTMHAWLRDLDAPAHTLLRLRLQGVVRPAVRQALAARMEEAAARLFHLETDDSALITAVDNADLIRLPSPLLQRVAGRLQEQARGNEGSAARRALELLFAHAGEVERT